jgi:hypothetical protein
MKLSFFLLFLVPLFGELSNQDDVAVLQELTSLTKKSLEEQEQLLKLVIDFQEKRQLFIDDSSSSVAATKLVKSAKKLETEMVKSNLTHLLSEELLTEVRFFANVGKESHS